MNYDTFLIPFGKHRFTALCRLPASYLLGIYGTKGYMDKYPEIKQYIQDNLERLKNGNGITRDTIPKITMPCDKYCYLTEREASKELQRITDLPTAEGQKKPCRHYYCDKCGAWHLTSKTLSEFQK